MKYTIKNLTNSPYTVPGANGPVHVPARGGATGDFDALQIAAIRDVGYFEVSEGAAKRDPLDHDGDGERGGFVQSETPRRGRPPKNKD